MQARLPPGRGERGGVEAALVVVDRGAPEVESRAVEVDSADAAQNAVSRAERRLAELDRAAADERGDGGGAAQRRLTGGRLVHAGLGPGHFVACVSPRLVLSKGAGDGEPALHAGLG